MASTINAITTGTGGVITAGDTSGNLSLQSNGSTVLAMTSSGVAVTGTFTVNGAAPGIAWQAVQTTGFTAVSGRAYPCNTTSAAFTVTLPASPSVGDQVFLADYAGTWATNNITVALNGNKMNGLTVDATLSVNRQTVNFTYIDSTQGWIAAYGFLTTSTITQTVPISYAVIAGGGGGGSGNNAGGGGGAGGALVSTSGLTKGVVYTVTVGGGGSGSPAAGGFDGVASSITGTGVSISAVGGGGAGSSNNIAGRSGGSGGGGGAQDTGSPSAGGSGTPGQGFAGITGIGPGTTDGGGGGGGAGGTGSASNGGPGITTTLTGSSIVLAGGGGGGRDSRGGVPYGLGGPGTPGVSGGNGTGTGNPANPNAGTGVVNTGGGGGGGSYNYAPYAGVAGGSGTVIISVATSNYPGTYTGTATTGTNGSNTWIRWTGSGTYTA
jgi:hypothetical protein